MKVSVFLFASSLTMLLVSAVATTAAAAKSGSEGGDTTIMEERHRILDSLLRSYDDDAAASTQFDDDYNMNGCVSFLMYDEEDCSGPVQKLYRSPMYTQPNCRKYLTNSWSHSQRSWLAPSLISPFKLHRGCRWWSYN